MFPQYVPDWNNPKSSIIKRRETELRIDIAPSGGQIYVFGADRPDLMRGPNPQGVILDEYSVQKPEVWNDIIQPVMRSNPSAWCWFLFTPRGRNHAYDVFQNGLRGDSEWKSHKLTAYESGIFTPEQLEFAKRDMPENTFRQELLCEFLEGEGSVFRSVRQASTAVPRAPEPNHLYVMGVDLAKVTDYTVVSIFDRQDNAQVYQDRFQTLEWPYQKQKIYSICKHYNNALTTIDATGLGDPIADDLTRMGVPINPFKISEQSKKDLIEKLSIWIEQRKCSLLPLVETFLEYDNFSYEISQTGKVRYQARDGFHDDIVLSHALAINGLQPISREPITEDTSRLRQHYLEITQGYRRNNDESEW